MAWLSLQLRQCGKPFASFPNWVSLSYLAVGREKAAAVHSLCQLQQIGFLQFKLGFFQKKKKKKQATNKETGSFC